MASPTSTLLLLPPVADSPTYAAIRATYHASLATLLRTLNKAQTATAATRPVLDVALACPHLATHRNVSRSSLFTVTQTVVANVYKLICIISAQNGYDVEGAEGLDVRVLLLAYPTNGRVASSQTTSSLASHQLGPIVELSTLAACHDRWQNIYGVKSHGGEDLIDSFLEHSRSDLTIQRLPEGTSFANAGCDEVSQVHYSPRRHFSVANGGTFDHLHVGHKLLLTMTAFALDAQGSGDDVQSPSGRVITIGITAEDLLKNKKYAEYLESWHERYAVVHSFLLGILDFGADGPNVSLTEVKNPGPNGHVVLANFSTGLEIRYVEIWDACGPTITDANISALILSEETRGGGKYVNEKRREVGFDDLDVFEVTVLDAEEGGDGKAMREQSGNVEGQFQSKLSSTEIRKARSQRSQSKSKV